MDNFCSNPWIRLGIYRDEQYICCEAGYPSLAHPQTMATEINDDDFYKDGILWKLWNSSHLVNVRQAMLDNGYVNACGLANCDKKVDLNGINPLLNMTEKQQSNYDKIKKNIIDKKTNVDHYPLYIELCLNYTCNMSCPYCHQKTNRSSKHYVPIKYFQNELFDYLQHSLNVLLIGGEPLICDDYELIIDLTRKAQGAKLNIVTNGHFIIQKVLPNIDLINTVFVSIDASSEKTYSKMRYSFDEHYNWDRLLVNISKLAKQKNICRVFLFVITGYNYTEMPDMIKMSHEYGAHSVCFTELFEKPYVFQNIEDAQNASVIKKNPHLVMPYLREAIQFAKDLNINFSYNFPSITH